MGTDSGPFVSSYWTVKPCPLRCGDRKMIAWLDLAARGEAEVVTSPMALVEAYDGRTTGQRWD